MDFFTRVGNYCYHYYRRNDTIFRGPTQDTSRIIPFNTIQSHGGIDDPLPWLDSDDLPYATCGDIFWKGNGTDIVQVRLRDKAYIIGKGIIMETLSNRKVLRPIIVCGITPNHLTYYKALLTTKRREPTMDCVTTYIHPEMDTPRGPWPGIRQLYKKFLKDWIKGSHKVILEYPAFIYKKPVPITFDTKETKAEWLRTEVADAIGFTVTGNRNRDNE